VRSFVMSTSGMLEKFAGLLILVLVRSWRGVERPLA
jgi:hypothetical protein